MNADEVVEKCFKCGKKRTGKWALLFSPPHKDEVTKKHICPNCYEVILSGVLVPRIQGEMTENRIMNDRIAESKPKRPVSVERIEEICRKAIVDKVLASNLFQGSVHCVYANDAVCKDLAKAILAEINEGEEL